MTFEFLPREESWGQLVERSGTPGPRPAPFARGPFGNLVRPGRLGQAGTVTQARFCLGAA